MRFLILAALALGLAGAIVVGAASASAQEPDDTLDQLSLAGIPLLNSPSAPAQQQVPPGQPGPEGQPPPDTLVDLPDPTDWIPNPTDFVTRTPAEGTFDSPTPAASTTSPAPS